MRASAGKKHIVFLVENASVPNDMRVWKEARVAASEGFDVTVVSPRGTRVDRERYVVIDGIPIHRYRNVVLGRGFLSYFIAAISRRFPKFGNQSNAALRHLASLEEGAENLIVTIANEIVERIDRHFVIVLDDYQFVDNVPEVRSFISRFIQLSEVRAFDSTLRYPVIVNVYGGPHSQMVRRQPVLKRGW